REGNVEKQVLLEAKESDIDFIFIGTHGASGFREKLFGSNTWKIIKNSDVPVISIPKDAHAFTEIKRIVFATEYREGEIPVINYLTKFAKQFNAEVIVLHISSHILSKEHEKELYDKFRAEVKNEISYKNIDMHFTYHDNIIEGLNNFCVRTKTDLLVMSPEKPFFLEKIFNPSASITKKASYNTHIPLLTIPDFYNPVYAGFWKMFEQGDQYWNEDL
ncbi:MAG: universal stress protein, partial [Bacteroidia bacterium]